LSTAQKHGLHTPVFDCLKDRQFTTTIYKKFKGTLIWLHTRKLTTEGIIRQAEREVVVELKMLEFTKAFFTSVIFTEVTHASQNDVKTTTPNFIQTGQQM